MAFPILLQQCKDEKNVVSKKLTTITTVQGTLREECSITDPIITFEGALSSYALANYMYIEVFKRYYYINNITSISEKLFQISAHVDVLMSFKSYFLNCQCIVKRQENNWNLYLNDGSFRVYQNPIIATQPFPNGFEGDSFILAVAGSDDTAGPEVTSNNQEGTSENPAEGDVGVS